MRCHLALIGLIHVWIGPLDGQLRPANGWGLGLERIEAPTLVLWGGEDRALSRGVVDDLMEVHPAWTFRIVDGIGHFLPWEAPGTYVELLTVGCVCHSI